MSSAADAALLGEYLHTLVFGMVEAEVARQLARPRFVSKRALAEQLGVSERRIKTLREHGLPTRKIGRDLYFDLDKVTRWIEHQGT